ncbi:hypothetical protein [Morganella psychrotolerans]|nr:hypothetical protein [Morganella psychrotolerans]
MKANLAFLIGLPKGKCFHKERLFYIRSAAVAKRSLIKLQAKEK